MKSCQSIVIDKVPRNVGLYEMVKWVAKAMSTDDTRYILQHIWVGSTSNESRVMVATDGRRVHAINLDNHDESGQVFKDGLYQVLSLTTRQVVLSLCENEGYDSYPKWENVFPTKEGGSLQMEACDIVSSIVSVVPRITGVALNDAFLIDAMGFGILCKKGEKMAFGLRWLPESSTDPKSPPPVEIITEYGHALVMPMRQEPPVSKCMPAGEIKLKGGQ